MNPLLDAWKARNPNGTWEDQLHAALKAAAGNKLLALGSLPSLDDFWAGRADRNDLCARYAWAIPNDEALDAIAKVGPIVEVGAGTGYWASLLADRGVDVVAYDLYPPPHPRNHWHEGAAAVHFPVARGGPAKVARHPDRALMLCWPPYAKPMAFHCVRLYAGSTVVYIGEGAGGCTGDDRFHELLGVEYGEPVESIAIPQWPGIHDRLEIFRRKPPIAGRAAISE